jgi:Ca-activated chloride channel family protein
MSRALIAVALALGLAGSGPASQQTPVFRGAADTVSIWATVRGENGRLLTDLVRDEFEILDNGRPVPVTNFSSEIQPITAAAMVGMFSSMRPLLPEVQDGLNRFVRALRPEDRIRLGSFGSEVAVSPYLTSDKAVLERVIREEMWPAGHSFPWAGAYAGMDSLAGEPGRRVILIVGYNPVFDGNTSEPHFREFYLAARKGVFADVYGRARREGFMVYVVGVMSHVGLSAQGIDIAKDTGGGYVAPARGELAATLGEIAEELRRQYLLGFSPVMMDGKEHRLAVRVTRPGATVRARTSFVAPQRR